MRTAVYAGSFDPPTNGHLWVIKKGSRLFEKLVIVLATNPDKRCLFSEQERLKMLTSICQHFPNVEVALLGNRYLAHLAKEMGAGWALRGIRNESDYQNEVVLRDENNKINPLLETVFLFQPPELRRVSSSFVKSLAGPEGWKDVIKDHVPFLVYEKFLEKFEERRL